MIDLLLDVRVVFGALLVLFMTGDAFLIRRQRRRARYTFISARLRRRRITEQ